MTTVCYCYYTNGSQGKEKVLPVSASGAETLIYCENSRNKIWMSRTIKPRDTACRLFTTDRKQRLEQWVPAELFHVDTVTEYFRVHTQRKMSTLEQMWTLSRKSKCALKRSCFVVLYFCFVGCALCFIIAQKN